jgi:hypothetical protein
LLAQRNGHDQHRSRILKEKISGDMTQQIREMHVTHTSTIHYSIYKDNLNIKTWCQLYIYTSIYDSMRIKAFQIHVNQIILDFSIRTQFIFLDSTPVPPHKFLQIETRV